MTSMMRRLRDDERGMTTVYLAITMAALLAFAGLIGDGSSKMRAGREATTAAREAGRVAGQELQGGVIVGQTPQVDTAAAAAAARTYLREVGIDGEVTVSGQSVTVTTQVPWSSTFSIVPDQTLTGSATVRPTPVDP
mgnify:CR=1 FL=1